MLLKFTKTFLLLFCFSAVAIAQQGYLRVVTLQEKDRQPIQSATISIYSLPNHSLQSTIVSDNNGIAFIKPESYPCEIEIRGVGYESFTKVFHTAPINVQIMAVLEASHSALEEVVFTGVSQPMKAKNALANYKVITRAEIQARGAVTLDEALRANLNINISSDPILGKGISVQGMQGNKVKILIDGIPVNGRENGNINLAQLNMNNVERIEIIQGPMSVSYGTDALGGVVNVITRKEKKPFEFQLGGYYGSLGNYNLDGLVTYKLKKHQQFTLSGGRNFFQGYQNTDGYSKYGNDSILTQRAYLFKPNEQYIGNFAYSYTSDSQFRLNFNSDFLREEVQNRTQPSVWTPQGSYANDEYYTTYRSMNRLGLEGKLGQKGHWQSQFAFNHYDRNRKSVTKNLVTLEEKLQDASMQANTIFDDVIMRGSYNNSIKTISYTAGYDVNMQFAHGDKMPGGSTTIQDYALYATASIPLLKDKLTAQLGGRGSYNTSYTSPVIPSLNLLYTPVEKLQFRASYTEGFRAPQLKEMYLDFKDANHNLQGNANLQAEKSKNVQLSGSYQVYEEGRNYAQIVATGYYNDVRNGIVLVNTRPQDSNSIDYQYRNNERMKNVIGSLSVDGQLSNFHYQVGYGYTYTFDQPGYSSYSGQEVTATLQYAFKRPGININAFYKYTGPQPYVTPDITGVARFNGNVKGYQMLDGSLEKRFFNNRLQLIAGVKNIFNIERLSLSGASSSGGAHGSVGGPGGFMPRSIFTSLRLTIN